MNHLKHSWRWNNLLVQAQQWFAKLSAHKSLARENSPWWSFVYCWKGRGKWFKSQNNETFSSSRDVYLQNFIDGSYLLSPLQCIRFPKETIVIWEYADRLILSLLWNIIQPTLPYVISKRCRHLKGPSQVKPIIHELQRILDTGNFKYCIRTDIKNYYASIDRQILTDQTKANFDDPRVLHYLNQIIHIPIDDGGERLYTNKSDSCKKQFIAVFCSTLFDASRSNI